MLPVPRGLFDVYALALPRGHGFGEWLPFEAWQSPDENSFAIMTRHAEDDSIGLIIMRRREDSVWTVLREDHVLGSVEAARERAQAALENGAPLEPLPSGVQRRTPLHDLEGREPSKIFSMLFQPSHQNVAWLLNQLYLALPRPDRNWAADCQTENFHTRLWEAQLLASFREQGILVTQPFESPDFRIENREGRAAWVEAVTANPPVRFEPVGARPTRQPAEPAELFFGAAALRFAKTIGNKLQRNYADLEHVQGMPFAIALADFHAPSSMMWSREALMGYLYGISAEKIEIDGELVAVGGEATRLLGASGFPAGLFRTDAQSELSAIIFTNACTLSKFNRLAITAGMPTHGRRYVRYGKMFDPGPHALDGRPFCLDVTSEEYRGLWPQGYEPWCAELEVFHNPFARHPLPHALLPEATHWFEQDGAIDKHAHYPNSILWSGTLILDPRDPMPTYETIPAFVEYLARRRMTQMKKPD
ncbi:hypothetical protein ACFQRC_04475 [Enterovirga sp. GCM10030262]|uniref:hypothetical protein n=1 Tax=Enterovirga sp. GCM10030262 TaxID=3273391 RepID=UPI00360E375F